MKMAVKANRIWATRVEAIVILATLPVNASATDAMAALFNSKPDALAAEVTKQRATIAASIRAEREKQDKLLAQADAEAKAQAAKDAAAQGKTGTTGK